MKFAHTDAAGSADASSACGAGGAEQRVVTPNGDLRGAEAVATYVPARMTTGCQPLPNCTRGHWRLVSPKIGGGGGS